MKSIALLQSNYIPWKGYFDLIDSVDEFYYYDEVQYTKNDWRNRNQVWGPNGKVWLTIPVRHEYLGQSINEVKVASNNWNRKHANTIKSNYAKAKYFKAYWPTIEALYFSEQPQYLSEVNKKFNQVLLEILGIKTKISCTALMDLKGDKNERIIDLCKRVGADVYVSGPAAKSYADLDLFERNGITVKWFDYYITPYNQIHTETFDPAVTILDYLFNALEPTTDL